jgi:hypothetical protein
MLLARLKTAENRFITRPEIFVSELDGFRGF